MCSNKYLDCLVYDYLENEFVMTNSVYVCQNWCIIKRRIIILPFLLPKKQKVELYDIIIDIDAGGEVCLNK